MRRPFMVLSALTVVVGSMVMVTHAQTKIVRKIDKNLVEVIAVGKGSSKEEAQDDAFRKAVETGAGTYLHSQSETKDFALVRDTILTRSTGFLQSKKVLSVREVDDGIWEAKIQAVVSIQGVSDMWGVVTNLLKQMGRPKIMVALTENINGQMQPDSTLQTRVEGMLLKYGFKLVDKNQLKAIEVKDLQAAIAEDKPDKVQAIAKRFGAQLFIMGATTSTGQPRTVAGIAAHRYGADGNIRTFRSDTGQLLSARHGRVAALDRNARNAAKKALSGLGAAMAPVITRDILRFWQDAIEGRGEVQLEVENLEKFSAYAQLKKALGKIDKISGVSGNYHNKVGKFSLQSETTAEKLAEKLVEELEDVLDISDVSQNVIKARYKKP